MQKILDFYKKYEIKILAIVIVILFILVCFFAAKKFLPSLVLKKGSSIEVNYKSKFKDPGYKLTVNKKDLTKKVKVKGKVNTNKLGTYKITYLYNFHGFNIKKVRIVKVKDLDKPAIELSGSLNTYICPNTKYTEEGYKAVDNFDGDITKKVRIDKGKNTITYTAVDSSDNKTVVIRKIIKKDIVKPVINLEGGETVNVYIGSEYTDKYSATDNCDGDITKNVVVEGHVDINTIGTYNIKYTVSDKAGNIESVQRTVNVIKKVLGVVYLTFDDGPNEGTTNVILDILKEEGVKATFFVTNNGPDYLIKREYDEGHTVALHTASHNYAVVYASDEAYFNDLYAVQNRVKNITGYESKIVRFPGGSSNTISRHYSTGIMSRITQEVLNRGFKYYDWNISSGDAGGATTPQAVYANVVNNLSKSRANMILMHDIKWYTRDALRDIIRYGKDNGYVFDKITESTEMVTQRVNN